MISRRSVLKIIGMFVLSLFSLNMPAMAQFLFKAKKKSAPRLRDNVFVRDGLALVGVAGGNGSEESGIEKMIREAISLIGGFQKLGMKGKKILVKPNVVSGQPSPATTNPRVVAAMVKILYEEGAARVYVGDMSAFATLSTLRNMRRNGIKKAAEDNGAEVIVFEDYGWVEVGLPNNTYVKKAYVTEWLYDVDLIVNLPVIKTHRSASYSITLKNFIGCTHLKQRPYIIDPAHWEEVVAEFNGAYAPDINIVDGTISMVEGGPWEGTPAETNLIIASADRVAADIVGLGIIKSFGMWEAVTAMDVWDQKQIKTAIGLGIGRDKGGIRLLHGGGNERFRELMKSVREKTGLMT